MVKAWDCDLPPDPYERAEYWAMKAAAAEEQAALRDGREAETWRAIADCWREALGAIDVERRSL